jgi:hypothetical protein
MDEAKISLLVHSLNEGGKGIPTSVAAIRPFPVSDFDHLRKGIQAGTQRIMHLPFRYQTYVFALTASAYDKALNYLGLFLLYIAPVLCLLLAVMVSWWFLLGLLLFSLGIKLTRYSYIHAVLVSAVRSEIVFCLLYAAGQIFVIDVPSDRDFLWGEEPK